MRWSDFIVHDCTFLALMNFKNKSQLLIYRFTDFHRLSFEDISFDPFNLKSSKFIMFMDNKNEGFFEINSSCLREGLRRWISLFRRIHKCWIFKMVDSNVAFECEELAFHYYFFVSPCYFFGTDVKFLPKNRLPLRNIF